MAKLLRFLNTETGLEFAVFDGDATFARITAEGEPFACLGEADLVTHELIEDEVAPKPKREPKHEPEPKEAEVELPAEAEAAAEAE